jgi:hypothetical protein
MANELVTVVLTRSEADWLQEFLLEEIDEQTLTPFDTRKASYIASILNVKLTEKI